MGTLKKKTTKKTKGPPGAGGIDIPEPVMLPLGDLNFAVYNPRIMPPEQMAALKASLLKHGMVLNLVVQEKSSKYGERVIIGGHQRVTAMRELCAENGWAEPARVSCVVRDVGDAEAKLLNVALNNIEGEFDQYKLGELFASVRPGMTMDDVLSTGFRVENIDELVHLVDPPDVTAAQLEAEAAAQGVSGFASSITLSVEFDTVEQRDAAKDLLRAESKETGKKAGALLLRALKVHAASGKRHKAADGDDRGAGAGKKQGRRAAA